VVHCNFTKCQRIGCGILVKKRRTIRTEKEKPLWYLSLIEGKSPSEKLMVFGQYYDDDDDERC
jgi:hypothetical protein